jgi:hypothetical protein
MITADKLKTYLTTLPKNDAHQTVVTLVEGFLQADMPLEEIAHELPAPRWKAKEDEKNTALAEAYARVERYIMGPGPYKSVDEIRQACPNFFSETNMRGLNSIVYDWLYAGRYFVSSERYINPHTKQADARKYTLRYCSDDGDILAVPMIPVVEQLDMIRSLAEEVESDLLN